MHTNKRFSSAGIGALIALLLVSATQAQRNDVLIVPARARMIRLAFDLQALRGNTIVSYGEAPDPQLPLVHIWNRTSKTWQQTSVQQINQAPHIPAQPNRVYAIGLPGEIPQALIAAFDHASGISTLQTFSVADILTILDTDMQFSVPEWRALAKRYDLELQEIQPEQNRWGRFGPPRRYREPSAPQQPATPQAPPEPLVVPPTPAPEPIVEPDAEPLPEQQALFEYLIQYESNDTIDPIPASRGTITVAPEKGLPNPPAERDTAAEEEDFPEK